MGNQFTSLKPANMEELIEQTQFTDDELKSWYQRFLSVYADKALTIDDFKTIYGEQFPFGDASAFASQIFGQLDKNGDGVIDFREFMVWMSVSTKLLKVDERLKRVFTVYDLNSDGKITRDEMTETVTAIYKMNGLASESNSAKLVDDIFMKLDVDMDAQLSESEFIQGAKRDPEIMKILQCDWESKFVRNIEKRTSNLTFCCISGGGEKR